MVAEDKEEIGSLHRRTLELLKATDQSLMTVAQCAGVPYYWLNSLSKTKSPNVNRIQKVYEYLSGQRLL